jgi:hypothetical protein
MELIIDICKDLTFPPDKENIIKKYLLPILIESPEKFLEISPELLSNIFTILNEKEVEILYSYIQKIIGDFNISEFKEIKWKIGNCFQCKKLSSLIKCKKEHDEDCPYIDMTSPEGCGNLFCEECLFQICSDDNEEISCSAIRCSSCYDN